MIIFSIFYKIKVCCVYSLESPRRGDSNEYIQHTFSVYGKKISLNQPEYISTIMEL